MQYRLLYFVGITIAVISAVAFAFSAGCFVVEFAYKCGFGFGAARWKEYLIYAIALLISVNAG